MILGFFKDWSYHFSINSLMDLSGIFCGETLRMHSSDSPENPTWMSLSVKPVTPPEILLKDPCKIISRIPPEILPNIPPKAFQGDILGRIYDRDLRKIKKKIIQKISGEILKKIKNSLDEKSLEWSLENFFKKSLEEVVEIFSRWVNWWVVWQKVEGQ